MVTFDMTILVIDLLELVEVDHENKMHIIARLGRFTYNIFLELSSVVETRKLIDRYLIVERDDVYI